MPSERRNFYRILHLQPDAPEAVVRSNFVTLMHKLRMHPDLGGEHWNAAQLSEAYATLSDPVLRAAYDRELLARYDVAALGQGHAEGSRSAQADPEAREHGLNRRNYYRVLQVQREAPAALIESSHATLRRRAAAAGEPTKPLDEALEILRDPERRQRYDALLASRGCHLKAVAELADTSYAPCITRFCAFCKTPHGQSQGHGHGDCAECRSPLFAPPESFRNQARRAIDRLERKGRALLYRYWPSEALRAQLVDLSPTGMRFSCLARFEEGEVLKIDARDFRAVGEVAHRRTGWFSTDNGVRFVSVAFRESVGSFLRKAL